MVLHGRFLVYDNSLTDSLPWWRFLKIFDPGRMPSIARCDFIGGWTSSIALGVSSNDITGMILESVSNSDIALFNSTDLLGQCPTVFVIPSSQTLL